MAKNSQRSCVSPFMAVAFTAVAVTGVLILFHLQFPGAYSIHKWGGVVFVLAGVFHLVLNWRPFTAHFKSRNAVLGALVGILALICIAVAVPSGDHGHANNRNGQHFGQQNRR